MFLSLIDLSAVPVVTLEGDLILLDSPTDSSPATYTCTAMATPAARISWFGVTANGTVPLSGEMTNTTGSRTVSVLSLPGEVMLNTPTRAIVCMAWNNAGAVNASTDVTINGECLTPDPCKFLYVQIWRICRKNKVHYVNERIFVQNLYFWKAYSIRNLKNISADARMAVT